MRRTVTVAVAVAVAVLLFRRTETGESPATRALPPLSLSFTCALASTGRYEREASGTLADGETACRLFTRE